MEIFLCICFGLWHCRCFRSIGKLIVQTLWLHGHSNWNMCNHNVGDGSCWVNSVLHLSKKNWKLQKGFENDRGSQLLNNCRTLDLAFTVCGTGSYHYNCRFGRVLLYTDHRTMLRSWLLIGLPNGRGSSHRYTEWRFFVLYFYNDINHKFCDRIWLKVGQYNCNVRIYGIHIGWMYFVFQSLNHSQKEELRKWKAIKFRLVS
jgi:hypothetical protein